MRRWYSIVTRRLPRGGEMILRLFSDGADAYRFAAGVVPPGSLSITLCTDASTNVDGSEHQHAHYWAVKSWVWENYRWENREPAADCIPTKDACPCGESREHVAGTPWPPTGVSPMPPYDVVRFEAGPRPRKPRAGGGHGA